MEEFKKFLKGYHVRRFSKGELIMVQGEVPSCAYVIKKGIVKTYNLTSQGEEKPIGFDVSDEIFPIGWVFSKISRAQYYYEAFTDCELYCIPAQDLIAFMMRDSESLFEYFNYFVTRHLNFQMRVNALEQSKAASKVLNTIHYLCVRYGIEAKKDLVRIQLPLTQQDLANFMGLTRETTGIELKKLQRKGVLTYRKQNYVVRTDKLNDLLDEDYEQHKLLGYDPSVEI
jgi:CRP-like cAMP-binding protein